MISQFKVFMDRRVPKEVEKTLLSGMITQGQKVEEFEEELKKFLGFEYGLTVNSCTSALWLALYLIGVGPGDKVLTTPMTCSATNSVIQRLGADIVWADVDYLGNIDVQDVQRKKEGVKAIVAVDWGGTPVDYNVLRSVAGNIPIVEDAAHAYGAGFIKDGEFRSVAKSGGDFVAFSFQAIKHLTCGDGGLLVVPAEYYERAKLLRWFGLDRTKGNAMRGYQNIEESGFKFHMNDIAATIGLGNINGSRWVVEKHKKNANYYNETYKNIYCRDTRVIDIPPVSRVSSYWLYTIHVPRPLAFQEYMKLKDIGVSQVHVRNDDYSCFSQYKTNLPNLNKWFDTMIAIPVGWWLRSEDLDRIVEGVSEWLILNQ